MGTVNVNLDRDAEGRLVTFQHIPPVPDHVIKGSICTLEDNPLFFLAEGKTVEAKAALATVQALCAMCPVQPDCAEYAIPHAGLWGIWGGTTKGERERIRQERLRQGEEFPRRCGHPKDRFRKYENRWRCMACIAEYNATRRAQLRTEAGEAS